MEILPTINPSSPISSKPHAKYFLWIVCLYLVVRLGVLFSSTETIHLELYRGTLALELLNGLRLPWGDYIVDPYALAPLFNAMLTIPSFLIFGKSLFALKFVPFLWHFFSLIAWFFVWRSFFPARQVFFILLLFVFAPPRIVEYSLSNHGTHFEGILWTALALLVLKRWIESPHAPWRLGLLLGFISGFSSSLHLIHWVSAFVILVYIAFAGRLRQVILPYGIGFLIGFAPWLYHNFNQSWEGFSWPSQFFFYEMTFQKFLHHLWRLFLQADADVGLKGLLGFRSFPDFFRIPLTYGYVGIYLFSLFLLGWRQRRFWNIPSDRLEIFTFAFLYQMVLLALVVFTQHGQFEYYLFPLIPFMAMTIALRRPLLGFCLAAGLLGFFSLLSPNRLGKNLSMQGYSLRQLGDVMEERFGHDSKLIGQKMTALLQNRSEEEKEILYREFPESFFVVKTDEDIRRVLESLPRFDPNYYPVLYEKFGSSVGIYLGFDAKQFGVFLNQYGILSPWHPDICRGAMFGLSRHDASMESLIAMGLMFCRQAPPTAKPACYEGLGTLADPSAWPERISHHLAIVPSLEKDYTPFYFLGLGRYYTDAWIKEPEKYRNFIHSLDEKEREGFCGGIKKELSFLEDPWRQRELEKILAASLY